MAVNLPLELPELLPIAGVRIATAAAGIKYPDRTDIVAFELAAGTQCAAIFTRNAFCAAPVTIAREHLSVAMPRLLLVNSGNANAGTGKQGYQDALTSCTLLADAAGCIAHEVLPFSTGVIGESLPMDKISAAIPALSARFDENHWDDAAHGIMTTDTRPKGVSRQIMVANECITITGIAKGSGMICPDMATMLAYVATDANIAPSLLQQCLRYAADRSFNCISVDGDTSTNDACVLMATGEAMALPVDDRQSVAYQQLRDAITEVCVVLAQAIIRDGEGATKFITVTIEQASSKEEAR
ncbi:MAG: bifunctional ornithine acetyltransferase/N-acetylglutamate synthase, partial [Thiotrichales bacterium]